MKKICSICYKASGKMVKCLKCSEHVHKNCLPHSTRKKFTCDACTEGLGRSLRKCDLCPNNRKGFFIRSQGFEKTTKGWVHLPCVMYLKGARCQTNDSGQLEANLTKINLEKNSKCFYCKKLGGSQISCLTCGTSSHVPCGVAKDFVCQYLPLKEYLRWTVDEVANWLKDISMERWIITFRKFNISGEALGDLTVAKLQNDMKIKKADAANLIVKRKALERNDVLNKLKTLDNDVWIACPKHKDLRPDPKLFSKLKAEPKEESGIKKEKLDTSKDGDILRVACLRCGATGDEENFLLCETPFITCNNGAHTYCLDPPLAKVPNGMWYCPSCTGRYYVAVPCAKCGHHVYESEKLVNCAGMACNEMMHKSCLNGGIIPSQWLCAQCELAKLNSPLQQRLTMLSMSSESGLSCDSSTTSPVPTQSSSPLQRALNENPISLKALDDKIITMEEPIKEKKNLTDTLPTKCKKEPPASLPSKPPQRVRISKILHKFDHKQKDTKNPLSLVMIEKEKAPDPIVKIPKRVQISKIHKETRKLLLSKSTKQEKNRPVLPLSKSITMSMIQKEKRQTILWTPTKKEKSDPSLPQKVSKKQISKPPLSPSHKLSEDRFLKKNAKVDNELLTVIPKKADRRSNALLRRRSSKSTTPLSYRIIMKRNEKQSCTYSNPGSKHSTPVSTPHTQRNEKQCCTYSNPGSKHSTPVSTPQTQRRATGLVEKTDNKLPTEKVLGLGTKLLSDTTGARDFRMRINLLQKCLLNRSDELFKEVAKYFFEESGDNILQKWLGQSQAYITFGNSPETRPTLKAKLAEKLLISIAEVFARVRKLDVPFVPKAKLIECVVLMSRNVRLSSKIKSLAIEFLNTWQDKQFGTKRKKRIVDIGTKVKRKWTRIIKKDEDVIPFKIKKKERFKMSINSIPTKKRRVSCEVAVPTVNFPNVDWKMVILGRYGTRKSKFEDEYDVRISLEGRGGVGKSRSIKPLHILLKARVLASLEKAKEAISKLIWDKKNHIKLKRSATEEKKPLSIAPFSSRTIMNYNNNATAPPTDPRLPAKTELCGLSYRTPPRGLSVQSLPLSSEQSQEFTLLSKSSPVLSIADKERLTYRRRRPLQPKVLCKSQAAPFPPPHGDAPCFWRRVPWKDDFGSLSFYFWNKKTNEVTWEAPEIWLIYDPLSEDTPDTDCSFETNTEGVWGTGRSSSPDSIFNPVEDVPESENLMPVSEEKKKQETRPSWEAIDIVVISDESVDMDIDNASSSQDESTAPDLKRSPNAPPSITSKINSPRLTLSISPAQQQSLSTPLPNIITPKKSDLQASTSQWAIVPAPRVQKEENTEARGSREEGEIETEGQTQDVLQDIQSKGSREDGEIASEVQTEDVLQATQSKGQTEDVLQAIQSKDQEKEEEVNKRKDSNSSHSRSTSGKNSARSQSRKRRGSHSRSHHSYRWSHKSQSRSKQANLRSRKSKSRSRKSRSWDKKSTWSRRPRSRERSMSNRSSKRSRKHRQKRINRDKGRRSRSRDRNRRADSTAHTKKHRGGGRRDRMRQKLKTSRDFSSSSGSEFNGELPKRKYSSTRSGSIEILGAVGHSTKAKKSHLDLNESPKPQKQASHIPVMLPRGETESSSASVQVTTTIAPIIERSNTSNTQETVLSERKRLHSKRQFSELSDSPKIGTWTHEVAITRDIKKPNTSTKVDKPDAELCHGSQVAPLLSVAVPKILPHAGAFSAQQVRPYIPHQVPEVLLSPGNVQRAPQPIVYQEQQSTGDVNGVMSKKNPLKESSFPMNESLLK